MSLFPGNRRGGPQFITRRHPGSPARLHGRVLLLAGVLVSQLIGFGAPTVASAAPPVAPVLDVGLYHGNGGSSYQGFNGNGSAYPNPQDLTRWGAGDWRLWGFNNSTSLAGVKRATGRSLINDLQVIPPATGAPGLASADGDRPFTFQWTGGSGPGTGSKALAGLRVKGEGAGFTLTAKLPKDVATLRVWVSASQGTGVFSATVPGLPTYTNTDMVGKNNDHGGVFELNVAGSGDVTINYTLDCPQDGGCTPDSHVTMYAAAYTGSANPPAFSVDVSSGAQSAFTITQGQTAPLTSSVTTSVINGPVGTVTLTPTVTTDDGNGATGMAVSVTPSSVPIAGGSLPADSAVTLTPAVDVAAGTYHVTVTGMGDTAPDVNTANLTVVVLPRTQVPFLYRAFPNQPDDQYGGTAGGITVTGVMTGDPAQTYRVDFYGATSCSASRVAGGLDATPSTVEIDTDGSGSAYFANAIGVSADSPYVTAKAVSYLSGTDANGADVWTPLANTGFGPCIVVSQPNESWPWALPLQANANGVVNSSNDQYIDDFARSRWYMFPVQPGSRVHITVSDLPKDYDVYLFRDIMQAYQDGTTLLQQSAEYAPPAYAPPAYAPPAYAPDSFAPPAYAPPAYAPPAYAPPAYAPPAYAPPAYAPPAYAPPAYAPPAYAPPAYAPPAYADANWAPPAYAPPAYAADATNYSSAQVRSLIGWDVESGTLSATIDANTWTSTGNFYIRVNGKSGLYDVEHSFHISITTDPSVCEGVDPIGTAPTSAPVDNATSLILWNSDRIAGSSADKTTLATKLTQLAARADVKGAVVDLAAAPYAGRLDGLYAQADTNHDCVYATNLVASGIRDVVTAYGHANPDLKYVVLAGGDDSIPFFRYPDPAYLGPESDYIPPVTKDSPSEASLRSNYMLGQDEYGASTILNLGASRIPIPDLAVGRLVESATDVSHMIDTYAPPADPAGADLTTLTPTSALETGYDFLADTASAVSDQLVAGMGASATNHQLISEYGTPTDQSWTADDLRSALLGPRHDVIFLAGHFSSNEALAADFSTRVNVSELAASSVDLANSLVFSNGCHSGYNLVDGAAITGVTEPLDWAQAFAQKGATLVAGTGYQYGDTDFLEYSERIYAEFAHQLRVGSGPVAVGQALNAAKLFYMSTTQHLSGLHEKAVLEAALFGLPMFTVDMPGQRDTSPGSQAASLNLTSAGGGLSWADFSPSTPTQQHTKVLDTLDASGQVAGTTTTTWLSGTDGASINPGDPVLPLDARNVTQAGKVLRGVVLLGGSYTDTVPVVPLTATAGTELGGTHLAFGSPTFYPERPWSVNYLDGLAGGSTSLMLTPAQHRVDVPGDANAVRRTYSGLDVRLYYLNSTVEPTSNIAAAQAPSISGVKATVSGSNVTFKATLMGDPNAGGAREGWITWTVAPPATGGSGAWASVKLNPPPAGDYSNTWTSDPIAVSNLNRLRFLAQAVSTGGAVSIDTNFGQYYTVNSPTTTSSLSLSLSPTHAVYGTSTQATATMTPAASGRTIIFRLGSTTRTATTNASGIATATLPLQVTPGTYTATASFAGDETYIASSAVQAFTVDKVQTTTVISHDPAYPLMAGAESGVKAVVTDSNGDPLAFRTLFFVVATYPEGTDGYSVTRLTDATGTAYLGSIPTPFVGDRDYAINAYYASPFSSVPDSSQVDPADLVYNGSSARLPVSGGLTIAKGDQAITFDPIDPKTFGDEPFTVSATASSGLPVTFTSGTPATCSLSGSTVTLLAAGDCTLTASQGGDDTWNRAPDVTQTVSTAKATALVTIDCTTGAPVTYTGLGLTPCTATAKDGSGNDLTVTIDITYDGAATAVHAGTYEVVATVNDANYQGSTTGSVTIVKATLTVTPDDQSIAHGSAVPSASFYTSSVTGFVNGETAATASGYTAPSCTTDYSSTISVASSPLDITCSAGTADDYTFVTTATAKLTITKATQAALTITGPASATYGDADQAITTTGGSGTGELTFDAGTSTACSIVANKLHVTSGTGTCAITATKAADDSYEAATSAAFTVSIAKALVRAEYTGDYFVQTGMAPSLSLMVVSVDGSPTSLDLAGMTATFSVYPAGCSATCLLTPAQALWTSAATPVDNGTKAVRVSGPANLADDAYIVIGVLSGSPYVVAQRAVGAFAIYPAKSTYVVGGGYVDTGANDHKGFFGFNVKKAKNSAIGSVAYVYPARVNTSTGAACATLGSACRDVYVLVRSTSLTSAATTQSSTWPVAATATGNASLQFLDAVDATLYNLAPIGKATFRYDVYDAGVGGASDTFGFSVYVTSGGKTSLYHAAADDSITQSGTSSATNMVQIGGTGADISAPPGNKAGQ